MQKLFYKNVNMLGFEEPVEVSPHRLMEIFKRQGKPFIFMNKITKLTSNNKIAGVDVDVQDFPAVLIEYCNEEVGHSLIGMQKIPAKETKLVGVYAGQEFSSERRGEYVLRLNPKEQKEESELVYIDAEKSGNAMRFAQHFPPSLAAIEEDFEIDASVPKEDVATANLTWHFQKVGVHSDEVSYIPELILPRGAQKFEMWGYDYGEKYVNDLFQGTPRFFNKKNHQPFDPKYFVPKTYSVEIEHGDTCLELPPVSKAVNFENDYYGYFSAADYGSKGNTRVFMFPAPAVSALLASGKRYLLLNQPLWCDFKDTESKQTFEDLNKKLATRTQTGNSQNIVMVASLLPRDTQSIPKDLHDFLKPRLKTNSAPKPQSAASSWTPSYTASSTAVTPGDENKKSKKKKKKKKKAKVPGG